MAKQIRNWYDSKSFRTYAQASFQSASMFRFLIAGGACPERLAALRGFLSDLKGEGAVEDLFAVRFGFNYEGFLKRWKDAIESEGPHDPAPGLAAEKIRNVVGPFIKDSQRPLMDRVVAIRDLGMGGYVEGAAALIELLRARGDIPEAEIIWALGAISGRTLGTDPEAWTAWIRDRRMLSEAPA